MNKITCLFGSGADTDFTCGHLKSGAEFTKALIQEDKNNQKDNNDYIDKLYKYLEMGDNPFSNYQILYPQSRKIYAQTIVLNKDKSKDILNNDIVNLFEWYYNKNIKKQKESSEDYSFEKSKKSVEKFLKKVDYKPEKEIEKESDAIGAMCRAFYQIIKEDSHDYNKEIKDFFFDNMVFFDFLDEKFNSLRFDELNSNAKRVIVAYALIYIEMVRSILGEDDSSEWDFQKITEKLIDYKAEENKYNEKSYYHTLKEIKPDCNIVTTNYTNFAEDITGKKVIYLHGNLCWFEDLKNLTVFDCKNKKESKELKNSIESKNVILPFILIPSGVKPIICPKQIEQFTNFQDSLNESDYLVVVGYRFNSEDNHINSFIAEWLKRKKDATMIYFNYNDEGKSGDKVILKKLKWLPVKEILNKDKGDIDKADFTGEGKIIELEVNKGNANDQFEKCMQILKDKQN